jgi:hypothetical protein
LDCWFAEPPDPVVSARTALLEREFCQHGWNHHVHKSDPYGQLGNDQIDASLSFVFCEINCQKMKK